MPKTILVIDDFKTTLVTVGITQEAKGYKVLKAGNGKEALKLFDVREIDLVISDYNMPGMNGSELTDVVRADSNYGRVPILILSTDTSAEKKKDALQRSATSWGKKPYQLEEFKKIIGRLV